MTLHRRDGWERAFGELLAQRNAMPFEWGVNCCASFAITAVEIVTDVRPWIITWRTPADAARVLGKAGGLRAAAESVLGPSLGDWRWLRRADLALVEIEKRPSLAVCTGSSLAAPGFERLAYLPLRAAAQVWRIG